MATNNAMNNFTTLIKRLEAATSRLEDMATSLDGTAMSPDLAVQSSAAETPKEPVSAVQPPRVEEPLPASIEDFDKIINNDVKNFVEIGQKIGSPVSEQSKSVLHAFEAERTYIYVSTKAKNPEPQPPELLTELRRASDEINNIRESNRPSPLFDHLSAVSEGVVALGWFFAPRPADFVGDILEAAKFYGNRVLKEYKQKDETHVHYIQAYYNIFRALIEYVKEHYPRGLTWNNADGIDAMEAFKQIQSPSAATSAPADTKSPPPPPPLPNLELLSGGPPAPPPPPGAAPTLNNSSGDMSSVFEQLNQGSAITSTLRKVDKSEMTHKNPDLRSTSLVPERTNSQGSSARGKSPVPSKKPKPESMRAKKPTRKQLDGNKWYIENYDNPGDVIEIPAEITHSILISHCNKTIVKVNNKANAISIDNCSGLSIIVDSLVSSVSVIKSPKFALQIDNVVPNLELDQVDGAMIYLSQKSLDTEVFTSKCSSVNILLPPKEGTDEDDKECPLPEQIRSFIKDGQIVSEIVEHAG